MRRRYRRLVGAACCVGAIGVMAALLFSGEVAGADQNNQGDNSGTGHAKVHGPPSARGHSNRHPGGWTSGSASSSASASAHVAAGAPAPAAAHTSTPARDAVPTAPPSAWTNPAPASAVGPVPAPHTTITLQGVRSLPPVSHPVKHPATHPAQIVEVAAAPASPAHDSLAFAAALSGLLFAVGVLVLTYGYRPGQRNGRHRSA